MINRDLKSVTLLTYNQTLDEYGQLRQDTPTETTIEMAVYDYKHTAYDNMLFEKVELIGITKHSAVTEQNVIRIDTVDYNIASVIKSKRFTEVFLYKV